MTDKQTRFGFTRKHFTLLGLVTPNAYTFVDNAPDAATVSKAWARIPTAQPRKLTQDEWDTYKDGAYKLETFAANVSSACSEASVSSANNFPTLLA